MIALPSAAANEVAFVFHNNVILNLHGIEITPITEVFRDSYRNLYSSTTCRSLSYIIEDASHHHHMFLSNTRINNEFTEEPGSRSYF